MKVFDVLTESKQKQVDEGPLRFAKRTLFKNTTMGKKAQISSEIDDEATKIYKDLVAAIQNQNDPRLTVGSVSNYLKGAGFISGTAEVKKALLANPTFMSRLKSMKDKAGEKLQGAKEKVKGAYDTVKKKVTPEPSNVQKNVSANAESIENLYYEAQLLNEMTADMELSKKEVYNIIKGFVKRGREAKVATGDYTNKSGYGDAPKSTGKDNKQSAQKKDDMMPSSEFQNALKIIKDMGYMVVDKEGKPVSA